ncbi:MULTISPECIES: replication endonuclease [Aliarcobacter]|uniref:Replication endonuclease n=1 Tax=Aliarcobacter butzleri TaxID=28197 RepID=A0AAP4PX26_9BACT|nr:MULTISPECIES: replication endonuclease [Aliarcobacter]MCT7405389.1 replication endonuclease [Aliarcobacter cryaerophilus]MCT7503135.1 replication endonuclease [Aliarcobacter cryaerophilus]MDN5051586.1 replication endonuclease [Aliarcobacter butzleri]MDN5074897.1 replication endonuclease [Aliarcobacter butzleri]MDN5115759.1 replication endonuclease [Aliarcobacter butzleri]
MEHIKQELYKYSLHKEKQQSNFLRNQQNLKNVKTGEVLSLKYSFDFKQKEYVKTIEQKVNALVSIAIEQNLNPIFITLTVPSKFHPFKTLKNGVNVTNKNYKFVKLDDAIVEAYEELKTIYRTFYKRLKNCSKNIYYIKITEPHKSLIPHMHILIFVENEHLSNTKKLFIKIYKEYKLQRVDYDESILYDNLNNAVGYIMKYVLKTLNSDNEFFKRWLDGWRKKYKIRACEMSNLPISVEVYKKLYYNLPKDLKESLQKEIESNNQSFFEYFIQNTEVHQIIYSEKEDENM